MRIRYGHIRIVCIVVFYLLATIGYAQCYIQKYSWKRPKAFSQRNDTIVLDTTLTTFNAVYDFNQVHVYFDRNEYYNAVKGFVEENPNNDTALLLVELVKKAFEQNTFFNPAELRRHIDFKSLNDEHMDPEKFVLSLIDEGMCEIELDGCLEKRSFLIRRTRIWWSKHISNYYMSNGTKITRLKEKVIHAKF